MARTVRRGRPVDDMPDVGTYREKMRQNVALSQQIAALTKRRENLRDELRTYASEYGTPNHRGHRDVVFEEPINLGDKLIKGFRLQQSVSVTLDVEAAKSLAEAKGITQRVIKHEVREFIDQDELWACQQDGILTREEIEDLLITNYSHSLIGL